MVASNHFVNVGEVDAGSTIQSLELRGKHSTTFGQGPCRIYALEESMQQSGSMRNNMLRKE
jgi:hypothetical protein